MVVSRVCLVVVGGRLVRFQGRLGPLCKCWVADGRCPLVLLVVRVVEGAKDRRVLVPGGIGCILILTCEIGGVGSRTVLVCLVV